MGILGQILKLTAISIFFSATATIYIVDSNFYKKFLNNLNSNSSESVILEEKNKTSKEDIKNYREYLRKTEIEKTETKKNGNNTSKTKSIWQNSYNN